MPIATADAYAEMLDRARAGRFAYPSVNVTSSETLNAAFRGFAEAESDGIIQARPGVADFLSGASVRQAVTGLLGELFAVLAPVERGEVGAETYRRHRMGVDIGPDPALTRSRPRTLQSEPPGARAGGRPSRPAA